MDSSTHPLQDSQRPTMTNAVERSVQHAPDLSEQDSQTTSPDESPRQSVSRGLGSNNDAANELHHDVIDAATGPAVQPTDQQEEQNTVNATRTDQASGTDGDRASLRSPVSSYIGGPGSANARSNPAEARRIVEPGPTVLNSQGTLFRMPASSLAGNMPGKPASAATPDTSAGRTPDGGTMRNKETQTPGNTLSQGTGDGKVRDAAGQPPAAAKPDSPYIGGPGSANARANPAEARRIVEPGPRVLNSQGTLYRMPASSLAGNMPGKPASAATPDTSAGRMPDGGTTRNKEMQTARSTLSQGTGDGKVRDATGQPPAAAKPDAPYIGGPGSANARANPAEARRMVEPGPTVLNSQGTLYRMPASSLAGNMPGKPASAATPDTSAGRMPDGGTTRNKEMQTARSTLSQGTGDGKVRDATGQPPAAAKPDAPYIGGPGSANARANPAEARRIVEPGPRVLNSQGTQFRMPASSLAGNMPGKPASAATPDTSAGRTPDGGTMRNKETQTPGNTLSQGTGDGKVRDAAGQPPAAAKPDAPYIGGPGSANARANPAEARRMVQPGPRVLNSQGTPFRMPASSLAGNMPGKPASATTPDTSAGRMPDGGTTRNKEMQTARSTLSQGTGDGKVRDAAGQPPAAAKPDAPYIGGPGSASARSNPAEARRMVQPGPTMLNSQGTQFRMPASSLAGNMPGKPASAATPDASQGAGDGKAHDVTAQSPASATSGSLSARANTTEVPRSNQKEPGMLNRQGSYWQGLDGNQASKVTPGQTYKSSSFVGSRGSSQATPYFSGVSKSTAKK
ncbi:hypothetical protein [Kluyvera genomosp. 3]|uniref:Uncharacterized protein n=1 Tax=Kluyvera genomosp. 3 TaxID=2774055 RepID=A0A6G9RLH7_9ENTR|nr:hypothetical protein [Kluyvera genomosp. 3]QIR27167.1 hypothetical protein GY169_10305 [Kluyvera genomosp. 3]